ncbi:MAG: alpha/beta hydrolase [Phycisphaerales bacterium]
MLSLAAIVLSLVVAQGNGFHEPDAETPFVEVDPSDALSAADPEPTTGPASELVPKMVMKATKDIQYIRRKWTRKSLTSLDVYQPVPEDGSDPTYPVARPILLFIHGGGWMIGDKKRIEHKAEMALRNGWIYVSINYRLSPRVKHPEHSRDAAAAIAYIHDHAHEFGGDPNKIVIMGHSAGAHIAAIVASDEDLLGEYGMQPSDLNGVVLLDGAGYDIPNQMNSPLLRGQGKKMYENAFGTDPTKWAKASPTLQAKPGDDLPPLLAIHIDRARSRIETPKLVSAWKKTGAHAQMHYAPNPDHAGLNTLVGVENDPDSQVVEKFIQWAVAQK